MHIRLGKIDDMGALQDLFEGTVNSVCAADYTLEQIDAWSSGTENKDRWVRMLSDQYVIVAEDETGLLGFCTLMDGFYIDFLFTHRDHQRKGIASLLYQRVEEEAIRQGKSRLVSDVSKTAKMFFEGKGFEVIQEQSVVVRDVALTNFHMQKILR